MKLVKARVKRTVVVICGSAVLGICVVVVVERHVLLGAEESSWCWVMRCLSGAQESVL